VIVIAATVAAGMLYFGCLPARKQTSIYSLILIICQK
jgi:hypothetical protein